MRLSRPSCPAAGGPPPALRYGGQAGLRGEPRDVEQMQQRIEADIEYINNWSVWLDLSILVRTLGALAGKNAY